MSTVNTLGLRARNKIINGGMDFWQRGTSVTGITSASSPYVADRFKIYTSLAGTGVLRCDQSTDVPTTDFTYSLKVQCTATQTPAAGEVANIRHMIEGYNYSSIMKSKRVTLSFWVKAFLAGTYGICLRNASTNRSLLKEYTITASNTWQLIVISFDTCSDGVWDIVNGVGVYLQWTLACGSTYQGTPDVWLSDNKQGTANQTNLFSNTSNTFFLAGVMLKEGEYTNPVFERAGLDIANELMLCQRYYEKSYDINIAPGTNSSVGIFSLTYKAQSATVMIIVTIPYAVPKRANNPVITMYKRDGTINAYEWFDGTTYTAITSPTFLYSSEKCFAPTGTTAGQTAAIPYLIRGHYTSDCEL